MGVRKNIVKVPKKIKKSENIIDNYGQLVKEGKAPIPKPFGAPGCTKYPSAPSVRKDVNPNYVPPRSVNKIDNRVSFNENLVNEIRIFNIIKILDNPRILSVCSEEEINYLVEYVKNYLEIIKNSKSTDIYEKKKIR